MAASTPYQIDLAHYFATQSAEQHSRAALLTEIDAFEKAPKPHVMTPALEQWLGRYDALSRSLNRHIIYVKLQHERDQTDHDAATAQTVLDSAAEAFESSIQDTLASLDQKALSNLLARHTPLDRYRFFIQSGLAEAQHRHTTGTARKLAVDPALASLGAAYNAIRRQGFTPAPGQAAPTDAKARYLAAYQPYIANETALAGVLVPIVNLQDGMARTNGYSGAPEAVYRHAQLSPEQVDGVLAKIRATSAYRHYVSTLVTAVAQKDHVPENSIKPWDLDRVDRFDPPKMSFPDGLAAILTAESTMGEAYADQFKQLFDPAAGRVDWCHSEKCDDAGFSVGAAGSTSGLFYGDYDGSTGSVCSVAHEAAHAVHRNLMSEHQPFSGYNEGPHFVFESYAIFNELLLLDHLYQTAQTQEARAYYLRLFLYDAVFQIYGSAKETDLEQSIYAGVRAGRIRTAADLDALTLDVVKQYEPEVRQLPEDRTMWSRKRLYYVDPLYSVNYLFAGLLALNYFDQYQHDPQGFSRRYMALLQEGFDDTPRVLLKRHIDIDLNDTAGLVDGAAQLIEQRTAALAKLYSTCGDGACSTP